MPVHPPVEGHETFGLVAVESMAAGAPLVTFDVGPLREVAGGGGALLVSPFDVAAFAEAAMRCVTEPGLFERCRQAGRAWANRYRWDALAKQQEQIYQAAVDRTVPRARSDAALPTPRPLKDS
jgi:glycogen synthase